MRWTSVLAVASLVLALAGPSFAAPDPTAQADAIFAQAKAATGGAAWDRLQGWHERGEIRRQDGQVGYEAWIDMRTLSMVSSHTADGGTVIRGFDGRTTWVIDPAGGVRLDASPGQLAAARTGAYFSVYGFFFPNRFPAQRTYVGPQSMGGAVYDVIRVTPAGGYPLDIWIDRTNHRVGALVDPDKAHPTITLLTDYRPAGGVLTPFTVETSLGGPHAVRIQRVSDLDFAAPDPAHFVAPEP